VQANAKPMLISDSRQVPDWETFLADQVSLHGERLFRLAYGLVRDTGAAEDACQQAFLKAWERRAELRDGAALKAWLTRVVVNEGFQVLRRRKTEKRALEERMTPDRHYQAAQRPIDDTALRESVLLALEQVPEPTRLVVTLRLMQGYSGNETKRVLGCSASEVSRRLHEGMEQLRPLLADWSAAVGR
jgi:RNA polymerase sigma factor (sigma-70 family)